MDNRETPLKTIRLYLGFTTAGGSNDGGRTGETGDLNHQDTEYGGSVNFELANSRPLYGGVEEPGDTGGKRCW